MKKITALLMSLLMIFALVPTSVFCTTVSAQTSGDYSYTISADKAIIDRVSTSVSGDVVIPSTLGGCPVVRIGDGALSNCNGITSLTIPNSITSIGTNAFAGCNNIASVHISDLQVWCNIMFTSHTDNPLSRGADLFLNDTKITSLVIPHGVSKISDFAFVGCNSITSVYISADVKSIGSMAFFNCGNLADVTVGDGVTTISNAAFFECVGLKRVNIGKDVKTIGDAAFNGCVNLEELTLAGGIESIGEGAFYGCNNISKVDVASVDAWCNINFASVEANPLFAKSANLYFNKVLVTKAAIPEGSTEIKPFVFYGCKSLAEIYIPSSVKIIKPSAFAGTDIKTVYFGGSSAQWATVMNIENTVIDNAQKVYNSGNIVAEPVSIELISLPFVTEYTEGEQELLLDGCKIKINYNNGTMQELSVTHDMVTGFDSSKLGEQSITITYLAFNTKFEITIREKPIMFIALGLNPHKTIYTAGQPLDVSGAKLAICHTDGSYKMVDLASDMVSGYNANAYGEQILTVSYGDYKTNFIVNVVHKPRIQNCVINVYDGIKTVDVLVEKSAYFNSYNLKANSTDIEEYKTVGNALIFSYKLKDEKSLSFELNAFTVEGYEVEPIKTQYDFEHFDKVSDGRYMMIEDLSSGDVNGDGTIDIKDLVRTKKIVAEIVDDMGGADVNGNGSVSASDMVALAKVIVSAKRGIKACEVTFADDNGNVLEKVYVPEGFGAKPSVIPEKDGCKFEGWNTRLSNITSDKVIRAIFMTGKGLIAKVVRFQGETFNGNTVDDTSHAYNNYLPEGTVDFVSPNQINYGSNKYYLMRHGKRVYTNHVEVYEGELPSKNNISVASTVESERYTTLTLNVDWKAPFNFELKNQNYNNDRSISQVTFSYVSINFCYAGSFDGNIDLDPNNPVFSGYEIIKNDNDYTLILKLRKTAMFYGWSADYNEQGQLVFKFLKPAQITTADNEYGYSLKGVRVLVDVGHGGIDGGSPGKPYDEADLNLMLAQKLQSRLESIGATVIMTRTADVSIGSDERIQKFLNSDPDFMISIHHNAATTTKPNGFGSYYFNAFSKSAAQHVFDATKNAALYNNSAWTALKFHYFYMCRYTACPAILTENGFMTNSEEYQNLIRDDYNEKCADALTKGIINYFKSIQN